MKKVGLFHNLVPFFLYTDKWKKSIKTVVRNLNLVKGGLVCS
jgi:hypothetical protein